MKVALMLIACWLGGASATNAEESLLGSLSNSGARYVADDVLGSEGISTQSLCFSETGALDPKPVVASRDNSGEIHMFALIISNLLLEEHRAQSSLPAGAERASDRQVPPAPRAEEPLSAKSLDERFAGVWKSTELIITNMQEFEGVTNVDLVIQGFTAIATNKVGAVTGASVEGRLVVSRRDGRRSIASNSIPIRFGPNYFEFGFPPDGYRFGVSFETTFLVLERSNHWEYFRAKLTRRSLKPSSSD
jgi:hypothetical protein